ncbi:MAG TPA: hypothetical protein VNK44_00485 [Candidatus Nitrosotenuis sp.]|nr:hypothetical protein [Candidatus Nitrosotenuis sp.]
MNQKQNSKIKLAILNLLEEGTSDRAKIYKKLQSEFGMSQAEARLACKEVKIELITKLKTLQSGMLEL